MTLTGGRADGGAAWASRCATSTRRSARVRQSQVSTIYQDRNQYRVVMEAAPEYWQSPSDARFALRHFPRLRAQVPLSAIAKYERPSHRSR
jgi:multidrug efflux pump subunit AcrB